MTAPIILPSQLLQPHEYHERSPSAHPISPITSWRKRRLPVEPRALDHVEHGHARTWPNSASPARSQHHVHAGERPGLPAADLAREYGIDASAVTRLIDRLEKRGLITRLRSEEDRRVVRLALTEEGHALAARIPAIFNGVLDKLLSGFTPEEVGFLKSMLRRMLVNSGDQTG